MTDESIRWLLKILQPESTLGSLPGIATLTESARAALLGLDPELYRAALAGMREGVRNAARELLADPVVATRVDRLPLPKGARIVAFGDSHTAGRLITGALETRRNFRRI